MIYRLKWNMRGHANNNQLKIMAYKSFILNTFSWASRMPTGRKLSKTLLLSNTAEWNYRSHSLTRVICLFSLQGVKMVHVRTIWYVVITSNTLTGTVETLLKIHIIREEKELIMGREHARHRQSLIKSSLFLSMQTLMSNMLLKWGQICLLCILISFS